MSDPRNVNGNSPPDGQMEDQATIYEFKTKNLYQVPVRALASTMIYAYVESIGNVWVDSTSVAPGRVQHPPFGEADRQRLQRIQLSVADADPTPFEKWEHDFRCDCNPSREMEIWERIASIYASVKARFDPCERGEVLGVLIHCTSTPLHLVEPTVRRRFLTTSKIRRIVAAYEGFGRGSSGQGAMHA